MARYPHARMMAAVEQACRETYLDTTFAGSVYAYLEDDESSWPGCCGSACEPCVLTLAEAARRARAITGAVTRAA